MKKVITFALQKGGVGKTSISVSVAVALAQNNYRVLLIDSDPQGNATTWLDIQEMNLELADVLMRKCSVKEAILPTKVKNLSIIPTAALGSELRVYSKTEGRQFRCGDGLSLHSWRRCVWLECETQTHFTRCQFHRRHASQSRRERFDRQLPFVQEGGFHAHHEGDAKQGFEFELNLKVRLCVPDGGNRSRACNGLQYW